MQVIDGVEYLDGDEAVALLGVKKATLYAYVSRGLLSSFRQTVGRKRLYRRGDIEHLCEVRPSDDATLAMPAMAATPMVVPTAPPVPIPPTIDDDGVLRDVTLPDAAIWVGEH